MGKINWNKVALGTEIFATIGSMWGARKNRKEIERLIVEANRILEKAEKDLSNQQQITNNSLERLGKLKMDIYNTTIATFSDVVCLFKNGEFCVNKIKNFYLKLVNRYSIKKIKSNVKYSKWVSNNIKNGVNMGVASASMVYGMTAAFGKTPDGKKIKELSGDAKRQATLERIGNGDAKRGQIKLAETAIRTSIVSTAGMAYNNSQNDLNTAKANYEQAKLDAEMMNNLRVKLSHIEKKSAEMLNTLDKCRKSLEEFSCKIQKIYYKYYDEESKSIVNIIRKKLGLELKVDCKKRLSKAEREVMHWYINEGDALYQMLKKPMLDKKNNINKDFNKSLEELKKVFDIKEVAL